MSTSPGADDSALIPVHLIGSIGLVALPSTTFPLTHSTCQANIELLHYTYGCGKFQRGKFEGYEFAGDGADDGSSEMMQQQSNAYQLSDCEVWYLLTVKQAIQVYDLSDEACTTVLSAAQVYTQLSALNPSFASTYALYHHCRVTLNYVVRSGLKYGCQYLLYDQQSVGRKHQHAVYAVKWLQQQSASSNGWNDVVHSLRVTSSVAKKLLIADVRPAAQTEAVDIASTDTESIQQRYTVELLELKRGISTASHASK